MAEKKKYNLNKPFRTLGAKKRMAVYVEDPKTKRVKLIRFGDPVISDKEKKPSRNKSCCSKKSDKKSPNYWARAAWGCG